MAGAFSGHLVDSFYAQQSFTNNSAPTLITSGAMSFNPQMHGTPSMRNVSMGDNSFSFNTTMPSFGPQLSEDTTLKIAQLQAKLNQKLGPEFISQRPGPGGGPKLTYAEGWKIINLANEVFGFNGWSSSIVNLTTDYLDYNEETKRCSCGTTAIIRVTLRDGVFHEDIGYGMMENAKGKGAALDKCKKEAVTDGLKRTLRNFGNLLGNCLYDKSYTQEITKIKVPPPKFDKSELYRRPEFEEKKPDVSMLANCIPFSDAGTNSDINTHASTSTSNLQQSNQNQQQQRPSPPAKGPVPPAKPILAGSHNSGQSSKPASSSRISAIQEAYRNDPGTSKPAGFISHSSGGGNSRLPAPPGPSKATMPPPPAPQVESDETLPDDVEESFHFSDDDAFLANVDLGEGDTAADLGRPIGGEDGDEDFGRPIDYTEGLGYDDGSVLSDLSIQGAKQMGPQNPVNDHGIGAPSNAAGSSTRTAQQQQQSRRLAMIGQALPSRSSNTTSTSNMPGGFPNRSSPPGPQSTTTGQGASSSSVTRTSLNTSGTSLSSSTSNSAQQNQRPTTPSMGGFNFPPGMDAKQLNQQGSMRPPLGQGLQNSLHRTASTIGQKRPSDAMFQPQAGGSGISGFKGGMGLSARSNNASTGHRQVLGQLEINEGGDVKRVRR